MSAKNELFFIILSFLMFMLASQTIKALVSSQPIAQSKVYLTPISAQINTQLNRKSTQQHILSREDYLADNNALSEGVGSNNQESNDDQNGQGDSKELEAGQEVEAGKEGEGQAEPPPPPGFENISAEQTTFVDAYFMASYIAPVMVTYDDKIVTIHNVKQLIDKLPDTIDPEDKIAIIQSLSRSLHTNAQDACSNPDAKQPCGILEPKVSGVILDYNNLRLDLFVNKQFLPEVQKNSKQYVPRSNVGSSLVSQFDGVVTSTGSQDSRTTVLNLNNESIAGHKEASIRIDSNYSGVIQSEDESGDQDASFFIQNIVGTYARWGGMAEVGMLGTQGSNFLSGQEILGAGFTTELEQIQNRKQLYGTSIELYLATPSTVQVYKQGKLISSQAFQAGNVYLDTTRFPTGSYEIQIKIIDSNNNTTETSRFYVKRINLPPLGHPTYYFNLGKVEINNFNEDDALLPRYSDETLLQAGMVRRMGDDWAIEQNLLSTQLLGASETGVDYLLKYGEIGGSFLVASDKDVGLALNANFNFEKYSLGSQVTKVWGHDAVNSDEGSDDDRYDPITSNRLQSSFYVRRAFKQSSLSASASFTQNNDGNSDDIYNLQYGRSSKIGGSLVLGWNVGYQHTSDDKIIYTSISLSVSKNNWGNSLTTSYRHALSQSPESTVSEKDYNTAYNAYWDKQVYNSYRTAINGGVERDDSFDSANVAADYSSNRGYLRANYRYNDPIDGDVNTQYSLNFATSLVAGPQVLGISNTRRGQTGFLVEVLSPNDDDQFDVSINGRSARVVDANTPAFIYAVPYKSYNVDVTSLNSSLYDFDEKADRIMLYKNNVKTIVFTASEKYVLIGLLSYPDGKQVSMATVEGGVGINQVDSVGYMHAELTTNAKQLTVTPLKGASCSIDVSKFKPENGLVYKHKLVCYPVKDAKD